MTSAVLHGYVYFIVLTGTNGCVNSCVNSPEDGPVGTKYVEIRRYTNKVETVTSVGFSFHITVYVSGYTEINKIGMLSPPTVWPNSVAADINSNVFDFYVLIWSLSRLLCCAGSGFSVAVA